LYGGLGWWPVVVDGLGRAERVFGVRQGVGKGKGKGKKGKKAQGRREGRAALRPGKGAALIRWGEGRAQCWATLGEAGVAVAGWWACGELVWMG
jgi:hypothetical protein